MHLASFTRVISLFRFRLSKVVTKLFLRWKKIATQREYFCDTCVLNGAVGGLGAVCTPVLFGWQLIFFMTLFKERKKEGKSLNI